MRCPLLTFDEMSEKHTQELLNKQLSETFTRYNRQCPSISDKTFIDACLNRVISCDQSGRECLQRLEELENKPMARTTFFDALHSSRRLDSFRHTANWHYDLLCQQLEHYGVDFLKEFKELSDYNIFSADGHFISHATHTPKSGNKVFAAGNIFSQNMRNGLMKQFACVTDGSHKNHEMPYFKQTIEKMDTNQGKTIWVIDRGYMNHQWWERQMAKSNFIISRAKSNAAIINCGQFSFDVNDPVNAGVVRDKSAAFASNARAIRVIEYVDPETGEEIIFYTTLDNKIRPGVICWLYFLRWRIEKTFDCFKNSLGETKAWATGKNALQIQGHAISMIYNFIHFLSETVQKECDCKDEKAQKNYQRNIVKRAQIAKTKGKSIHPLIIVSRKVSRISSQFIRSVRNYFFSKTPLYRIWPILVNRLKAYL